MTWEKEEMTTIVTLGHLSCSPDQARTMRPKVRWGRKIWEKQRAPHIRDGITTAVTSANADSAADAVGRDNFVAGGFAHVDPVSVTV